MNRGILVLGAIVIAAMAAVPLWDCMFGAGPNRQKVRSAGYAPIWAPPDRQGSCRAEVSWSQLGVQSGGVAVLALGLAYGLKRS